MKKRFLLGWRTHLDCSTVEKGKRHDEHFRDERDEQQLSITTFQRLLGHVDLKAVLHIVQSLGVGLVRHEGDGQTFGSKPTGTSNLKQRRGNNEVLDVLQGEGFVPDESEDSARRSHHDFFFSLVLLDGHASEEHGALYRDMYFEKRSYSLLIWKASSRVFDLLQRGQHEHGRLSHTGLRLAQDVHAQDRLWDALMLD
ncbi:hypothetical protein F7725_003912 [Dissostichus mawsoni]|uniref:Uncharacterized protein n=1 Tax=Dissostichus mawsoni TaxID=36200 RepID=A0A7J5YBL4_DISMA|nr:hypothetical protein F7725_003912 [Dissostichus mawsoni]